MKWNIKHIIPVFVSLLFSWQECFGQVYSLTKTVLENTKNSRKKQDVRSVESCWTENGTLIINFIADLDKNQKRRQCHILLHYDSVLKNFRYEDQRMKVFDSATAFNYFVGSADSSTHQVFRYGANKSRGIELMCLSRIIRPGFYNTPSSHHKAEKITVLPSGYKDYQHKLYGQESTYLEGKHIVLLFFPEKPIEVNGTCIEYLILNIENNRQQKKLNNLVVPFAAILDTALLPFVLMMSGMQK